MIYILSWTTKKHQKTLSRPLHSKLKKIQGLFKDLHNNLRTFQGTMEFKDFSRTFQDCANPVRKQRDWQPVQTWKDIILVTSVTELKNLTSSLL